MRVVINQPNYIPWRGYFDLIDDADLFLYHDDVQYTKQGLAQSQQDQDFARNVGFRCLFASDDGNADQRRSDQL
jgi:hypothetical protein